MADPMTRDKLRDLLSDMVCGIGEDGAAVMDAVDELIGQECAEVVRLRSQLAMHLTAWRNASRRARVWRERVNRIAFANVRAERVAEMANRTLGEIEGRVAAAFAAADRDGVSLDAMTVAELTDLVMGAVRRDDDPARQDDVEGRAAMAAADCGHCDHPLIQVDGTWLHKATRHEECRPDTEPVICAAPNLPA